MELSKSKRLGTLKQAMHQMHMLLQPNLALINTHGAEFLSDGHWDMFLSKEVQSQLEQLNEEQLVNLPCCQIEDLARSNDVGSCILEGKGSQIQDLGCFLGRAKECLLENFDVLTPICDVLNRKDESASTNTTFCTDVISEAMSEKKTHEVGIMVDVVSSLFNSTQSNMVVDVGSGKGYFASELSRKHQIPVVGFDSCDTNTHGASKRDKQLAKKWTGLERRKVEKGNKKSRLGTTRSRPDRKNEQPLSDNSSLSPRTDSFSHSLTNLHVDTSNLRVSSDPSETDINRDGSVIQTASASRLSVAETRVMNVSTEKDQQNEGEGHKQCQDLKNLYLPVTLYVHPKMDLFTAIGNEAPGLMKTGCQNGLSRLFLTGLHTCGSLAVTTMQLFTQDPSAIGMCCVGCCYHLMEEKSQDQPFDQQDIHFPLSLCGKELALCLGRNARNLALQSVHRISGSGQLQGGDFLWRALLNVLLQELGIPIPERIVGMRGLNKRCRSFQEYVTAAFKKLSLSDSLPDSSVIEELERRHAAAQWRMSAFFQLRLSLAPVIEGLILLDRLAYLLEQENIDEAYLVQLFDPVTSPRCFALIAMKKDKTAF